MRRAGFWGVALLGFLSLGGTPVPPLTPEDKALFEAIQKRDVEQVREALRRGAHVTAVKSYQTPLSTAAGSAGADIIVELLRAGADPNACPANENCPLERLVQWSEDPAALDALVKGGADARRLKDGGAALLSKAASLRPRLVPGLLAAGASSPVFKDRAVLERAARAGDVKLLQALLDPYTRRTFPGEPLRIALLAGDLDLMKDLLRAGIPPEGSTLGGDTPLSTAMKMSSPKALLAMFEAGVDVNGSPAPSVGTPLGQAVDLGRPDLVKLLLARGAKLDHVPPSKAMTALGAAASDGSIEMVRLLLQLGADPNLRDARGRAPLELVRPGPDRHALVAELLAGGARPERAPANDPERSAIAMAAKSCDEEGILALLQAGAAREDALSKFLAHCDPRHIEEIRRAGFDLNRLDITGATILQETAALESTERVSALLEMGADPNLADTRGRTALHRAAELGLRRNIRVLVPAGAEVDVRDRQGHTPGDLYWKWTNPQPRSAGDWPSRFSFSLPADLKGCQEPVVEETRVEDPDEEPEHQGVKDPDKVPAAKPLKTLVRCASDLRERELGIAISLVPRGASLSRVAPGEVLTRSEMDWHGTRLEIGHLRLTGRRAGRTQEPEVWVAVVPGSRGDIMVETWAPPAYGVEAGWMLRGIVGSLKQAPIHEQVLDLKLGWIVLGVIGLFVAVALLGAGALWLIQTIWPGFRPLLRLTEGRKAKG